MKYMSIALLVFLMACSQKSVKDPDPFGAADLNYANRKLLEVAMEDGFPPPVASRVYVYPHIAHYTALQIFYPDSLPTITGKVNGLAPITALSTRDAHPELTALLSFAMVAQKVVFSEHHMDALAKEFMTRAKDAGMSPKVINASATCADQITRHMVSWIAKDNYVQTRTMDRYTSTKRKGQWIETPPDYVAGMEPHWDKIRPIVIDSPGVYQVTPPPVYNEDKSSDFYKMVYDVYAESQRLDAEKKEISWFWDDNPNVSEHRGHLVVMIHKISPPGHWLNIIAQISRKNNDGLFQTTKAYTFTAIAMFDSIISCWYEKYKTNLVRPITYIQENIDINWKPLIQTPPFPEFTSGHSAISASAATVLTHVYGDNFAFTDSTGTLFDLPVRSFTSFDSAAWEVSLSRYYAGIHYMQGVVEGNAQGKAIGQIVIQKLR